jgi:hypothetical protein
MRKLLFSVIVILSFSFVQQHPTVTVSDFNQSVGEWKGSITYLDYSNGKPFTMPANTTLVINTKTDAIILKMIYPDEPKANGNDTLQLSKKGILLDGKEITDVKKSTEGITLITTALNEVDGNDQKKCTIKHSYIFNKTTLVLKKEVLFDGEINWILRNEYSFKR